MIRMITYFVVVAAVAVGAVWLAENPGQVAIDWRGYRIEITGVWLVILFLFSIGLTIFTTKLMRWLFRGRAERRTIRRMRRSYDEIGAGLDALIAGDGTRAGRHAEQFAKLAGDIPVGHFLSAQAALVQGNLAVAKQHFSALERNAQTQSIGLRGQLAIADQESDKEAQLKLAVLALRKAPKAAWAQQALLAAAVAESDWTSVAIALRAARSHGHLDDPEAEKLLAVAALAQAQGTDSPDKVRRLARESLRHDPDLVPARTFLAGLLHGTKKYRQARSLIKDGWTNAPHPDLVAAWAGLRQKGSAMQNYKRVQELTATNIDHPESQYALAYYALAADLAGPARKHLDGPGDKMPQMRVFHLLAEIEEQSGNLGAAQAAADKAAIAAPDPAWICQLCQTEHTEWQPACDHCGGFASVMWGVATGAIAVPLSLEDRRDLAGLLLIDRR